MSAFPDLAAYFLEMEKLVEAQPDSVVAEIARGAYAMSPRPRVRHGATQGELFAALRRPVGVTDSGAQADWMFVIEPEIRSLETFSRLAPDLAGWRRSTTGWPDLDATPVSLIPDWVAEVLSPGTESFDRGPKKDAYGQMGVGWLWLLDPDKRTVETFSNVRSKMIAGPVFGASGHISAPPFESLSILVGSLFPDG
ncbi:MAG: Uma2 family endonuclease [Acidobacteriota bacterium]|nr:Uma2 family endonuclease [Acidobacteriota bacterium]